MHDISTGLLIICHTVWVYDGLVAIRYFHVEQSTGQAVSFHSYPDSKVHAANMGPTWVLSAPGGPRVGPINPAIRVISLSKVIVRYLLPLRPIYEAYTHNSLRPEHI